MTNDNLGFMVFPEITAGIPRAEEAPTDTIHIPAGAKNVEDAKKFLRSSLLPMPDQAQQGDQPAADQQELAGRRRSVPAGRLPDALDGAWRNCPVLRP